MTTILISGGRGLIGTQLCAMLRAKGYKVNILSRTNDLEAAYSVYKWNVDAQEMENEAVETADFIIHLAGENIGGERWTTKRQQVIIDSRVASVKLLFDKVKGSSHKPKAFISASAIGYYGAITTDHVYLETDVAASDFLGETCRKWEEAANRFEEIGIRTVKIRTGVVLTRNGGALEKMKTPVKFGISSALGSGKQFMPWIHIDDLCEIYIKAIEDEQMSGAYNAVAPEHKTNREFTKTLASVLHKPFVFPNIPSFLLKLLFGRMSEMLLKGSRVSSEKIIKTGFRFRFPQLESALRNIIKEA